MHKFRIDFLESYDKESILAELRRIAAVTGRPTVTKADIEKHGRLSYEVVNKKFGSLRKALQEGSLKPQRFMKASDPELLEMLVELWTRTLEEEGRRPYRTDLARYGYPVSGDTYLRKFGSWKKALKLAYDFATEVDRDDEGHPGRDISGEPGTVRNAQPREAISLRKRFLVFKRDRYTCRICKRSGLRIEVDHIKPWAQAGPNPDRTDNLQTLCFECNRGKRNSPQ